MKTESKVRYEQAAYVYIGGKFLIALLVFFYACSSCQDFGRYIFYTALRTFLLGHFIYMGFRSTINILTVMNAAKTIFYIFDFSTSMAIVFPVPSLFNTQWILSSPGRGNPVLILTALLTGIVVFGLARAVWNPAFKGSDIMKEEA